jgi:hypothetical protein
VAAVAVFAHGYPVRFARRPLVLDEGMVRADGRVTIGGVKLGSGTFSSLDIGGAVSPIENLELGLSTELTGAVPAPGGIGLLTGIFSPQPQASYGDIPVYARYQFAESETALVAVDLVLVLPSNTDFSITAGLPLRIVELFGLFTMDMNLNIRYRNGDKYAAFIPNPSKNTAEFTFDGAAIMNITDNGYVEIGGGVGLVNVGGGAGAKNVVEIPFFLGGGGWGLHVRGQSPRGHLRAIRLSAIDDRKRPSRSGYVQRRQRLVRDDRRDGSYQTALRQEQELTQASVPPRRSSSAFAISATSWRSSSRVSALW